ncbi:metal-dependent hydrolase [Klebsiella pneumoniae]|uniref:Metal-dependent hydrolase n=1 Tax=Klebsiella pneumoniae TaxID=573 RepID=A0A378CHI8_KLEPN|nr:metal-dependent hydrolase [Klebsiella pneumoniae]
MTERVYYTSDATDGRAQIIACTAEADGRYAIELDRTLFHPQGGRSTGGPWMDCRAGG